MDAVLTSEKSRRVVFRGLPSPFADPVIQDQLARRVLSKLDRQALWRMEQKRQMQGFSRVPGRTQLTLGPEHGLSRTYVFGPFVFEVEMESHDIEILMRMHIAHAQAFTVVDDILVVRA